MSSSAPPQAGFAAPIGSGLDAAPRGGRRRRARRARSPEDLAGRGIDRRLRLRREPDRGTRPARAGGAAEARRRHRRRAASVGEARDEVRLAAGERSEDVVGAVGHQQLRAQEVAELVHPVDRPGDVEDRARGSSRSRPSAGGRRAASAGSGEGRAAALARSETSLRTGSDATRSGADLLERVAEGVQRGPSPLRRAGRAPRRAGDRGRGVAEVGEDRGRLVGEAPQLDHQPAQLAQVGGQELELALDVGAALGGGLGGVARRCR